MQVIFARRTNVFSFLLRTITWSAWSHCALITDRGTVVEALWGQGVVETPLSEVLARSSKVGYRTIACPDDAAAQAFALAQVGKPYDYAGVVGLALHRDWRRDDAWWCSELLEAAAAAGGNQRFIDGAHRVTPAHSWMVR